MDWRSAWRCCICWVAARRLNKKDLVNIDSAIRRLRELNEPVPKPLRLPTESEVTEAEELLGIVFLPDYKKFLLEASDVVFGVLEPGIVIPNCGHLALVPMANNAWTKMGLPRELLPICEDNADFYCLTRSNEVVFWSHNGRDGRKWSDIATWINDVWIDEYLEMSRES